MKSEIIKENADEVREKIKGGTLFGEAIDMENMDMIIFAAYSLGQQEELKDRLRNRRNYNL